MPEHFRALVVVLVLAGASWLAIQPSVARATSAATARQWRNLWFGLTITAFAIGSFWLYALLATVVLLARRLTPVNALAAYFLLLFTVPAATLDIPGFGLINYFFTLNQPRLLALVLLLPAAITLYSTRSARPGSRTADRILLGYVLLAAALQLRESNITSTLRGCFYLVIDILLPYYVASRALQRADDFRHVFAAYVTAAALLGTLSVFETLRHWNLYSAMVSSLGLGWGLTGYLARDGMLRASGSTGQAIVLGYVMAVGIGWWFCVRPDGRQRFSVRLTAPLLLMVGGLLASLSRGPWVGAVVMTLVFLVTGAQGMRRMIQAFAGGTFVLGLMALLGIGQRALNLLPFIGKTEAGSITYRQELFDNALLVIQHNFWFGSSNYLETPEMQRMIQGQGIIDIVNTFLGVTLDYGVVGLCLFAGLFALLAWQLWRTQAKLPIDHADRVLGRGLLAVVTGIAVMITTVSSISVISNVYWVSLGVAAAWLKTVQRKRRTFQHDAQT